MTEQEIIEGNKLIAEFYTEEAFFNHSIILHGFSDESDLFFDSQLKFHKSWDWLMPVVEKVAKMPTNYPDGLFKYLLHIEIDPISGIEIEDMYKRNFDAKDGFYIEVYEHDFITNVWMGIVEFIKWYNLNIKNNKNERL